MNALSPHPENSHLRYYAEHALLATGWESNVAIDVKNGAIFKIEVNTTPKSDTVCLHGPVLPTLANVHSHAFQRVMAGAAEVSLDPNDSFWSWRELMYKVVQKLTPDDVRIVATQLYIDMLKAGYTQVGEFHYLHHTPNGTPYQNKSEIAEQLLQAANDAGIGLTLLPVLYSYSGFGEKPPHEGQARFINNTESYLTLYQQCETFLKPHSLHTSGVCFHSLRAVNKNQIEDVLDVVGKNKPIHIHIAEQQKEVEECVAWTGQRPVQWLCDEIGIDQRWCLVHATHLDEKEMSALASSKATVGLCPTTEANLGDGIFPATDYTLLDGKWGIGSDSHVSLSIVEELRTLEYAQRLRDQQRNRLYRAQQQHIGDNLFQQARLGGNQACDVKFGLAVGSRADFMVLDNQNPFVAASDPKDLLNRWIFACNENIIRDVYVAGQPQIKQYRHHYEDASRKKFINVIRKVLYSK
ncbi:formimidoylglutamate deiminase [Alteromonas sp. 345S023]|uniref:Formimidoylglutamate deiminase n=1 Tax=Alteromonas profundi TaxID=2696062 RepID=A0A7X5LHV1_9ALTE|nr:formimidoylglutamate deiminase [Alteromonas profundi]